MTPFKDIWNKEFLTRVLTALETDPDACLLCHASDEFKLVWERHQRSITKLASKFPHRDAKCAPNSIVLFRPKPGYTKPYFNTMRDVRIAFLQHEINRLSI